MIDRRLLVECAKDPIDPYLRKLCAMINDLGGETIFSCSGLPEEHPHYPDGRKIRSYYDCLFLIHDGCYSTVDPYLTFARNDFGILLFSELEKNLKLPDDHFVLEPSRIRAVDHSRFFDVFTINARLSSPVCDGEEGLSEMIKDFWAQVYSIVEELSA